MMLYNRKHIDVILFNKEEYMLCIYNIYTHIYIYIHDIHV